MKSLLAPTLKASRPGLTLCLLSLWLLAGCGTDQLASGLPADVVLQGAFHPAEWEGGQNLHAQQYATVDHLYCESCHGDQLREKMGEDVPACAECHEKGKPDCASCHGQAAPKLGAHTVHVFETDTHLNYDCSTCHDARPASPDGDDRKGEDDEIVFGDLNDGASYSSEKCSNLYCHGDGGGNPGTLAWTSPTDADRCSLCHGDDASGSETMSGRHEFHLRSYSCDSCHSDSISSGKIITDKTLHINGKKDVHLVLGAWDAESGSCLDTCHSGSRTW